MYAQQNTHRHSVVIADGNSWFLERIDPILNDLYSDILWIPMHCADKLLQYCTEHSPELLIIDFSIEGMHLVDVVKLLRQQSYTGRIAVSSFYEGALYADFALEAGADTYFDKSMLMDFLRHELLLLPEGISVH
ncbi:MAG: response regulator [Bacteroidota bacterium]